MFLKMIFHVINISVCVKLEKLGISTTNERKLWAVFNNRMKYHSSFKIFNQIKGKFT